MQLNHVETGDSTDFKQSPNTVNETVQEENGSSSDTALNNTVQNHYIHPKAFEKYDVLVFLANIKNQLRKYLLSRSKHTGGIKWNLCIQMLMQRDVYFSICVG